MKYLDIFNESKEYNFILWNRLMKNEDNFFENEILEKINDTNIKQKIISELKNFNEKENKLMENFVRKTLNENNSETESFLLIEKIPNEIISNYSEIIYKEYLNLNYNKNKEIIKNKKKNVIVKKINIQKLYNELIIHNVFFEFALKNVRKRIELRNQYNEELTLDYITKLIVNEIKKLKLMILKVQNFSNENTKFSTFDIIKNQLQMNKGQYSNFLTNNTSPITSRYYKNTDIKFHNLNNRSIKINHPLNLGYMVKNNEYINFKNNMDNINNNNDNMYLTGVKKENQNLLQKNNIDKNSINKLDSSINLDKKNVIKNKINLTPKQFYDIYNNKRINKSYNFNTNDNSNSKIHSFQKKIIQINEDKLNNKNNQTHFSPSIDLSKNNEDNIQKIFKQNNSTNKKDSTIENNIKIIKNEENNSNLVNNKNNLSQNKISEEKNLNKNNDNKINNNKENTIKKINKININNNKSQENKTSKNIINNESNKGSVNNDATIDKFVGVISNDNNSIKNKEIKEEINKKEKQNKKIEKKN